MRKSRQMALCGMLAALALTVMVLGGFIPVATYCTPILAAAMLIPVLERCGRRIAWAWFASVAILGCLLCPDVEAAILFLCIGYYPIVRHDLNRVRIKGLRLLAKLLVFNLALVVMMVLLMAVFGLSYVMESFAKDGLWLIGLTWLLGNGVFLLTDQVLGRIAVLLRGTPRQ